MHRAATDEADIAEGEGDGERPGLIWIVEVAGMARYVGNEIVHLGQAFAFFGDHFFDSFSAECDPSLFT